jgi:hypothetical protein
VLNDFDRVRTENWELRKEMKSRLRLNKRLQKEGANLLQEIREEFLCMSRIKDAMRSAKPLNTAVVINFPRQAFTLEELEAANSAVSRDDVLMHLAYHVSRRQVKFFSRKANDEPVSSASNKEMLVPLMYQLSGGFRPTRGAA